MVWMRSNILEDWNIGWDIGYRVWYPDILRDSTLFLTPSINQAQVRNPQHTGILLYTDNNQFIQVSGDSVSSPSRLPWSSCLDHYCNSKTYVYLSWALQSTMCIQTKIPGAWDWKAKSLKWLVNNSKRCDLIILSFRDIDWTWTFHHSYDSSHLLLHSLPTPHMHLGTTLQSQLISHHSWTCCPITTVPPSFSAHFHYQESSNSPGVCNSRSPTVQPSSAFVCTAIIHFHVWKYMGYLLCLNMECVIWD